MQQQLARLVDKVEDPPRHLRWAAAVRRRLGRLAHLHQTVQRQGGAESHLIRIRPLVLGAKSGGLIDWGAPCGPNAGFKVCRADMRWVACGGFAAMFKSDCRKRRSSSTHSLLTIAACTHTHCAQRSARHCRAQDPRDTVHEPAQWQITAR